jgi:hypothetical protein
MDEPKFPDMPCDAHLRELRFLERQGVTTPIVFCEHSLVAAVIFRGYLCLRESTDATDTFHHSMNQLEKISAKEACAVLWQAMADLPDDVKDPLEQAMRALMDAKPE